MSAKSSAHYTFGDNELAARRLEYLAEAFAPSSRRFLERTKPSKVQAAVDLGSALGITTQLLAEITHAPLVVGYERSPRFLDLARRRFPDLQFAEVDVLSQDFPQQDFDLVYSRFLLTHLRDPGSVLRTCVKHLRLGGRVLLEETSNLTSPIPTLARYYEWVAELQAHHGQETYIGRRLPEIAEAIPEVCVTALSTPIAMPAKTMARMHAMNIHTWKRDPFMLENKGFETLTTLEQDLWDIVESESSFPDGTCEMGQVVVEKVNSTYE